jgi:hypothetical protein
VVPQQPVQQTLPPPTAFLAPEEEQPVYGMDDDVPAPSRAPRPPLRESLFFRVIAGFIVVVIILLGLGAAFGHKKKTTPPTTTSTTLAVHNQAIQALTNASVGMNGYYTSNQDTFKAVTLSVLESQVRHINFVSTTPTGSEVGYVVDQTNGASIVFATNSPRTGTCLYVADIGNPNAISASTVGVTAGIAASGIFWLQTSGACSSILPTSGTWSMSPPA